MTNTDDLQTAVERQHNCRAMLVQSVPVNETFGGKTVWEGVAHVFKIYGNDKATQAYASSCPIEGNEKRRFFAVLHLGGIRSSQDAVRAAIVAEHHSK